MPEKIDNFKNPAATASVIVERDEKILLVRRKHAPYQGRFCFPGGFLNYGQETLERTAQRELYEETGLRVRQKDLHHLCTNSSPRRDPRGHVIDHVYVILASEGIAKANDDANRVEWREINRVPKKLAFDHSRDFQFYLKQRKSN